VKDEEIAVCAGARRPVMVYFGAADLNAALAAKPQAKAEIDVL
jgi:hypothetical protein